MAEGLGGLMSAVLLPSNAGHRLNKRGRVGRSQVAAVNWLVTC